MCVEKYEGTEKIKFFIVWNLCEEKLLTENCLKNAIFYFHRRNTKMFLTQKMKTKRKTVLIRKRHTQKKSSSTTFEDKRKICKNKENLEHGERI